MMTIGNTLRITAAVAALGVNLAVAGGLASLAHHYDQQASRELRTFATPMAAIKTAKAVSLRCQPERTPPG